jgi:hypothetical protein
MSGDTLVTRVKIIAYKDPLFSDRKGKPDEIELQVNPSEISMTYGVDDGEMDDKSNAGGGMNSTETAAGESFKPKVFKGYNCPDLTIDTIVDATGVLPIVESNKKLLFAKGSTTQPSVQEYIKTLKTVCYDFVKECHGPPYLAVAWGSVFLTQSNDPALKETSIFKCLLSSMDVKYTLFSAEGHPVRAEIQLKFRGFQDAESRAKGNSPDLSHVVDVKYGDNLPALCKKIYGSPEFFLQVARINNLPSIYAIEPGMKLLFPPLEKSSR